MIPYGRQAISQADIDAVIDALKSDFLTQGPLIEKFERRVADYCGAQYTVAVASATAGLHIAYMALGMGPGKTVWTSPNTFVATANAALYCGANIDFVDIDPDTLNMSVQSLRQKLETTDKIPDLVVPVHFAGQSCDMKEIHDLSQHYGFKVVEDAAHCIGASYNGRKIGSCEFSAASVYSFHPVKIITTAEGGLVTTNDKSIYESLLRLRTHGITRDPQLMEKKSEGAWYFEQRELGYHYRITDMQCALGYSQMDRLDEFVARRTFLAARYNDLLADAPVTIPKIAPNRNSSCHLYAVSLLPGYDRRDVFDKMRAANIGVNVHYIPVHTQPYYRDLGFKNNDFPAAENYYHHALTLPLYPDLSEDEQDYVCQTLMNILGRAR